jgi:hypothetical protein
MSTQIFDAYVYKGTNSLKIKKLNFQLRELIESKILLHLKKVVIKDCIKVIDYFSVNGHDLKASNYEDFVEKLIKMNLFTSLDQEKLPHFHFTDNLSFYKVMYNFKTAKENYKYKIRFISLGKNTYYKLNLPKNLDIESDLEKLGLYEFDYYNNTDKPENIKNSEWNFRKKVWNNIFSNSSCFDNSMYSFYNEDFEISFQDFKLNELIEFMNDDETRLKYIYSRYLYKKLDLISKVDKLENEYSKLSNYMNLIEEFHDQVTDDISNLKHLDFEYKKYLTNIDEIFQLLNFNIFNKKST